ncbi:MAG: TrmH family RNA methyltransferase [Desulfonauticus sp.]|nr:TrmH family RNA methyltransferase [Desulfonauticus sp.]
MLTKERQQKIRQVLRCRQKTLTLVLNNIHDPHNVSAILRSCDAFGVPEVHLLYTQEQFPVLGKKSSASAKKWVECKRHRSAQELVTSLKARGFYLARTGFSSTAQNIINWDFTRPTAVILGNEHRGIEEELCALVEDEIYIPMYGMVQSFNVSVAAAIILYEAWRQRQAQGMYSEPSYSNEELKKMELEWASK